MSGIEINRIYNEDCLVGMRRIAGGSVDMICCDLPYGVLNRSNSSAQWDNVIPLGPMWEQFCRVIKDDGAIVLFCQGMFTARLLTSNPSMWRYNLVWDKGTGVTGFLNAGRCPLRQHEDIAVFYRRQPTYNPQFEYGNGLHRRGTTRKKDDNSRPSRSGGCYGKMASPSPRISDGANDCRVNYGFMETEFSDQKFPTSIIRIGKDYLRNYRHPTQKPVDPIRWLVRTYTDEGDTVLDACMGSGTTAVACIREKRNFIGFEITRKYFDIASRRIAEELSQPTLF